MISLHPYLRKSHSVLALLGKCQELGIPAKVRTQTPPKRGIVVNWGYRKPQFITNRLTLNPTEAVYKMTDKLRFFNHVGHNSGLVPVWTNSGGEAREWAVDTCARYKTAGYGGDGLVIWEEGSGDEFPMGAPLYTQYRRKTHEYRCHTFRNRATGAWEVRLTQRKGARKDEGGNLLVKNWKIRNHGNGFVYVQNDGQVPPEEVTNAAIQLMSTYFNDMHFCALDIIYHKPTKTALVLEGNTAPGLEGSTVDLYINYFKEWL